MRVLLGFLVAGLTLTLTTSVFAGEENASLARVEVLMVAVKPTTAFILLPKLQERKPTLAAFEDLMRMIEAGDADLLGWPSVTVRNGTRAVSETVEEVRYPTEFDPPTIPGNRFTRPAAPETYDWRSMFFAGWIRGDNTPTAFETRNVGQKLEVEASTGEDREQVMLSVMAEDLRFVKYHEFSGVEALNGGRGELVQPEFARTRFTGLITARNSGWMLLSSFAEQKPKPRVILFLLRAITLPSAPQ
jgi:hypothetical protein